MLLWQIDLGYHSLSGRFRRCLPQVLFGMEDHCSGRYLKTLCKAKKSIDRSSFDSTFKFRDESSLNSSLPSELLLSETFFQSKKTKGYTKCSIRRSGVDRSFRSRRTGSHK